MVTSFIIPHSSIIIVNIKCLEENRLAVGKLETHACQFNNFLETEQSTLQDIIRNRS